MTRKPFGRRPKGLKSMAVNIKTITSHLHSKNIIYGNSWDYLWQFMFVIIYYLTTDYADYSDLLMIIYA